MEPRHSACEPGKPIEFLYFPLNGVISAAHVTSDGRPVEIVTVGNEGMIGLPVFFGSRTYPLAAYAQVPGESLRIRAERFLYLLPKCPFLRDILLSYTQALLFQISQTMVCNRIHSVVQRCARCLLTTHDRAHGQDFQLTQESLARTLGVRRTGASHAAGLLRKRGLITYSRGRVTILNRAVLESECCECYQLVRDEFNRLFGKGVTEKHPATPPAPVE
jgi:CRP-like cAMP-binding protein